MIHAHQVTSPGLYGVLAARWLRRPVVVSAWGTDVLGPSQKPGLLQEVTKFVLRRADAVTSDAIHMSDVIAGWAPTTRLVTVPLGIERSVLERLGRSGWHKEKLILSPRQHMPIYRIDAILRATAPVLMRHLDWSLVIAGGGPESERLKQLSVELGIADRVLFTGVVPRPELLSWFSRTSITVSVPSHDATAVSLLEGMAAMSFPVVSDLPANMEWVSDGQNGYVIHELTALTDALERAVSLSSQELQKVGRRNHEIIGARAVFEEGMAQIEALYVDLIQRRSATST